MSPDLNSTRLGSGKVDGTFSKALLLLDVKFSCVLDSRNWAYLRVLICHTKGSGKGTEQKRNVQWHWFMIVLNTAKNFVFVSEGKTRGRAGNASQEILRKVLRRHSGSAFKVFKGGCYHDLLKTICEHKFHPHITSIHSHAVEKAEKFRKVKYLALKILLRFVPFSCSLLLFV